MIRNWLEGLRGWYLKSRKKLLMVVVVLLLLPGGYVMGKGFEVLFLRDSKPVEMNNIPTIMPTETPSPSPSPYPTPTPTVKLTPTPNPILEKRIEMIDESISKLKKRKESLMEFYRQVGPQYEQDTIGADRPYGVNPLQGYQALLDSKRAYQTEINSIDREIESLETEKLDILLEYQN
jgi:hypothetical protein